MTDEPKRGRPLTERGAYNPNKAKQSEVRELLLSGKTQTEIRKQVGCGAGMVTRVKKELEAERKLPLSKPETPRKKT